MAEYVENVKRVASELREWAAKNRDADRSAAGERMETLADLLDGVPDELMRLSALTSALPPELGNIHDLPQELLDELTVSKADELEDQIVTVINAYGGEASLDQILVGLFRKFKVVQKRRFMQNKLYRMTMVWSVDGRKGVYTTKEPDPFANDMHEATEGDEVESDPFSIDSEDSEIPF
ncbi:hypothetical protein [Ruegeria atlantica]|uniref:hypothetical protein n=1 Tax=Ruegeria atlantica TaxID=81569 RepID=UPI001480DDD3|nr:hypothetical protein [Ruegeria atlantica]